MLDNLRKYCYFNNELQDDFVGIRLAEGNLQICFPLGFEIANEETIKDDIQKLISVLIKFNNTYINSPRKEESTNPFFSTIPIVAYQNIIDYFMSNGYYTEKKIIYTNSSRGKINFSRTIKKNHPILQDNGVFYLKFQTIKKEHSNHELITLINKYCVYEAFSNFGFIFYNFTPQEMSIPTSKEVCISIVEKYMRDTFDDRKRLLFFSMKQILEHNEYIRESRDFKCGTYHFHIIWEQMIDKVFGVQNKKDFFPSTTWHLLSKSKTNHPLQPDTIMIFNDKVYVLDAKYYKFGISKNPNDLPNSSSIMKQIAYAEYIQNTKKENQIFNAFLLPYNKYRNSFNLDGNFENFGFATGEWRNNKNSFDHIQGILVDTRFLMENYARRTINTVQSLATIIEG